MGAVEEKKTSANWSAKFRWFRRAVGPWQPFTGRGVSAFRVATFRRVLAFQLVTALLSAALLVWVVRRTWFPIVVRGTDRLPEAASIADGTLHWPDTEPVRLAENVWLDWIITPTNRTELGQTADLQVELRPRELRINGLAGHLALPYRRDVDVPLGRIEASARWGAWSWVLLTGLGVATTLTLLALWWSLATLYTLPVLILAILMGRRARLLGTWRIISAALLPGALFADWSILAYGIGAVRLPGFAILFTLHLVVGWVWLVWGLSHCPRAGSREPDNPFEAARDA